MTYQARSAATLPTRPPLEFLFGLPFTCFAGALATDLAYIRTDEMMWADFSAWLLAAGLVLDAIAIAAGFVWLASSRGSRRDGWAWTFLLGMTAAWGLSLLNAFIHSRDAYTSVVPTGVALSVLVVLLMLATCVFGRSLARRPLEVLPR